ncbi:MAG: type IVB secretion system protein DotG/IcmE [Tatlockia sp.]|nr:type IVB secretion system protein DotG/IcmE [Tatlockia sp.]
MAGKKENLKSLFTNTRTRVIIIFTAVLLLTAVIIGVYKLKFSGETTSSEASVATTPGIQSIPGALNPTVQYAKLQELQNVDQATSALKTGGSAIPTIIRTQALGEGVQPIGEPTGGQGGLGFAGLAREDEAGAQRNAWIQALQNSSCSKSSVAQVVTEGATLSDLKAGCSCAQLKDNGYTIDKLEQICSCKELRAAGYNARQLKDAGFSAGRLRQCGFDACELRNAGFTAQQMKDGGFTDGELKGAGFSDADIAKASGLPPGMSENAVRSAGCQADALKKLREQGVTASAIRRISGCSATQLKAAGFNAEDLRNAGFSAADLKNAGFTPTELKAAGYTARELLNSGFTPAELAGAGFTPAEIASAESELPPGISPIDVKNAGCDPGALRKERLAGVSAKLIKQYAGCDASNLQEAGFTDNDLANAGFTAQQRAQAGLKTENVRKAMEASDNSIRAAGCNPVNLKGLLQQAVPARRIRELNNCPLNVLKDAGFSVKALSDACFSPQELMESGFTPQQLLAAGIKTAPVIAAGRTADCRVASLKAARAAGVSATTIKQTLGCSAAAMKAAGYTAKELRDAGFTAAELKNAGFNAADLKAAGFSAKELKDAGFSAADLKAAGFSVGELKDAGFSAADLKAAGFSAADLKTAGFSAKDLRDAGFNAKDLKDAGFNAKDLKDAGFSAAALRQAGYSAKDLANAGFSPSEIKNAGYTDAETNAVAGLGAAGLPGQGPSILTGIPGIAGQQPLNAAAAVQAENAKQLQNILNRQNQQLNDQRYQQKIQQRTGEMLAAANSSLQTWQKVTTQVYTSGDEKEQGPPGTVVASQTQQTTTTTTTANQAGAFNQNQNAFIKTGDVLFGVIDTSVNTDEPGPILATIISGKLRGAKLIGSFNLPSNASKMVISFNTMSVPGAARTVSISAYAIDPDTARTALSSKTNHHYLLRYGSLFASSFMEGIGNAFQSADTTVTIGGTGGGQNITVQNGINRSVLKNAVIALSSVGKSFGQVAQQIFSTPTTVEVYAGTGVGILFTQDVTF